MFVTAPQMSSLQGAACRRSLPNEEPAGWALGPRRLGLFWNVFPLLLSPHRLLTEEGQRVPSHTLRASVPDQEAQPRPPLTWRCACWSPVAPPPAGLESWESRACRSVPEAVQHSEAFCCGVCTAPRAWSAAALCTQGPAPPPLCCLPERCAAWGRLAGSLGERGVQHPACAWPRTENVKSSLCRVCR